MEWPEGFMWGTGASLPSAKGHRPPRTGGTGNGTGTRRRRVTATVSALRYAEDFALLASLGLHPPPAVGRMGAARTRARRPRPGCASRITATCLASALDAGVSRGSACTTSPSRGGSPTPAASSPRPTGLADGRGMSTSWRKRSATLPGLAAGQRDELLRVRPPTWRRGWPPGHNDLAEWPSLPRRCSLATAEAAVRLGRPARQSRQSSACRASRRLDETPSHQAGRPARRPQLGAGLELFRDGVLACPRPAADRAAGPGRLLRPDRLLLLHHQRDPRRRPGPVPGRRAGAPRSATGSGPMGWALCSTGSMHGARHAAAGRRVRHRNQR